MGAFETLLALFSPAYAIATGSGGIYSYPIAIYDELQKGFAPATVDTEPTPEQVLQARRDLALMLALPLVVVPSAPLIYAAYKGRKRAKNARTAANEERVGVALENASNASSTLIQTALAAPVVAAAYTYIAVQKAETGKLISKGLGDAVQTLLAVSASGPAIQGISSGISAFAKKGK